MTTETKKTSGLSRSTKTAMKKYGPATCTEAYRLNSYHGEGPSTVATYLSLSGVGAANAAINAGREIAIGTR